MARNTIRTKLLKGTMGILAPAFLAIIVVVASISLSQMAANAEMIRKQLREALYAKGKLLVDNNALALSGMVGDNAFLSVQELVAKAVAEDKDVVYGIFMTSERQAWVIADSANRDGRIDGRVILNDSAALWAVSQGKPAMLSRLDSDGFGIVEFAAPVLVEGEISGYLRYGFDTGSLRKSLAEAKEKSRQDMADLIGVLVALALLSLGIAFLMARRLSRAFSRPILELNSSAMEIAHGNYHKAIETTTDDEVGDLASSFEHMRITVKNYTEHLEELVNEKMRQVRDILDNIDQALFTVNEDGSVNDEYSHATLAILELPSTVEGCDISTVLHLDAQARSDWADWVDLVRERHESMRWEKLQKLAPLHELILDGTDGERSISISYQPVLDKNGELARIMVLAQDITESRKIEKIIAEEKVRHENEVRTILGLVNTLPEVVQDFFADTDARLALIVKNVQQLVDAHARGVSQLAPEAEVKLDQNVVNAIFRDLHTIKGNAATYGFESLSAIAHKTEDVLDGLRPPHAVAALEALSLVQLRLGELQEERREIDQVSRRLRGGDELMTHIAESKVKYMEALVKSVSRDANVANNAMLSPLLDICKTLRYVPLVKLSEKYRAMVGRVALKLGKQVVFACIPDTLELDPGFFKPINDILVHILRNAVDHGIETPEVREEAKKDPSGTVRMQIDVLDTSYRIKILDDGRGIDEDSLVRKAVAMGLIDDAAVRTMPRAEKMALLFMPGVSTKNQATDVSGRGVGMDSVQKSVDSLGGSIRIQSEKGFGTAFVLEFPQTVFNNVV